MKENRRRVTKKKGPKASSMDYYILVTQMIKQEQ